jgi:hypothetical protein
VSGILPSSPSTRPRKAAAIDEINRDYAGHARAARAVAAGFFDCDRVLADRCLGAAL